MPAATSHGIDHSASIRHKLLEGQTSQWKRYAMLVIGEPSLWKLLRYELIILLFGSLPGALGLALRGIFYPKLFRKVGHGVVFGRNLSIRNANRITIGNNVMIDDSTLIDGRGAGSEGIVIGDGVILNRESIVIAKIGGIHIGANTDVGSRTLLISTGGIRIGEDVALAGSAKIGGSMIHLEKNSLGDPSSSGEKWDRKKSTKGPIIIGDQCTVYNQTIVLDGVSIGARSMIGPSVVLREDVPEETIVAGHQKLVFLPLDSAEAKPTKPPTAAVKVSTPPPNQSSEPSADTPAIMAKTDTYQADLHQQVTSAVYDAIDELNLLRSPDMQLDKQPETDLLQLESMDLVNLIVETELQIEALLGLSVNLNHEATTEGREAFKNLASFIDQVVTIVSKHKG